MINNLSFEHPYFLLVLLLFILCHKFCKPKTQLFYMPHLNIYEQLVYKNSSLIGILKWASIVLAIIALSSPIEQTKIERNKSDGIDIVLALDTSGSMQEIGFDKFNFRKNRWDVVSEIVKEFIAKRTNDNIGIIAFGDSVMTASPLTYDNKAQLEIVDSMHIGMAGEKTALIDSIGTSVNILSKRKKTKSKIIIVLTDGEDTASTIPLDVVQKIAKKHKIKIYTIGIGQSNRVLLNNISKSTNGKSFSANNKNQLKDIYEHIDKLEKTEIEQNKIILKDYYFHYPLGGSLVCLILFILIRRQS